MESKYSELEKLSKLKENGTITNAEFESQKAKILNATVDTSTKKNTSKIFFIISIIGIIVSIILGVVSYVWHDSDMYIDTLLNNKNMNNGISSIIDVCFGLIIAITIVMLVIGIILKIKEKGGIKIVD